MPTLREASRRLATVNVEVVQRMAADEIHNQVEIKDDRAKGIIIRRECEVNNYADTMLSSTALTHCISSSHSA